MPGLEETIRRARQRRGWSQQDLADKAKVNIKVIGRLETGITKNPAKLDDILEALGITLDPGTTDDVYDPRLSEASFGELIAELQARHVREVRKALRTPVPAEGQPDTTDGEVGAVEWSILEDLPDEELAAFQRGERSAGFDPAEEGGASS